MNEWKLTDEESSEALESWQQEQGRFPVRSEVCQIIRDAQVKKMVEWIDKHNYMRGLDGRCCLRSKDWQAFKVVSK